MSLNKHILSKLIVLSLSCAVMLSFNGCSSLGISVWPAQFPLLTKTKEFAAAAPLPSGLPNELSKFALPDYFVEPGDRILIEPVDLESDIGSLGDQKIQVDGTIDLGEFGRIRVAGLTVEAIERAVEDQIALSGKQETINVQLIETNAAEVYVIGEVGSPAAYPIDGHEHVLDAILRAGGLTSKASPCDIILVRPTAPEGCRVVLPVCYRQITQLGDVTTNYQLQPGDRIVVVLGPLKRKCHSGSRPSRATVAAEVAAWNASPITPGTPIAFSLDFRCISDPRATLRPPSPATRTSQRRNRTFVRPTHRPKRRQRLTRIFFFHR